MEFLLYGVGRPASVPEKMLRCATADPSAALGITVSS